MTFTQEESLILSIDLGITTGLAVGRRMRTIDNHKWRYALIWDGITKPYELYGVLEQLKTEYSFDVVVIEYPILKITNPYYHELIKLVEELGNLTILFGGIPIIEVKPAEWKTTPAIRFKPADNKIRTIHQWDALKIGCWFSMFGYKKSVLAIDKSQLMR